MADHSSTTSLWSSGQPGVDVPVCKHRKPRSTEPALETPQVEIPRALPFQTVSPPLNRAPKASAESLDRVEIGLLPPAAPATGGTISGDVRLHQVTSQNLGETRRVWVYLPEGYEKNPDKKYPVLYTCDGEGVFDEKTAHNGVELGLDEKAAELVAQGKMSEVIIVAVSSGGTNKERFRDYAPGVDPKYGGGQADRYLAFLKDELKPMLDKTYRTETVAEKTGIMGSSLGGLFSLYAGFTAPHTFGLVGAISPSLWHANRDMLHRMLGATQQPNKVWLDMGTKEQENPQLAADRVQEFQVAELILQERGYQPGQTMFAHLIQDGVHGQRQFKQQAPDLLQSLFPPEGFKVSGQK